MAGITIVGGIGMIARLTLRNRSIVTTDTATDHFVVIQRCNKRQPGIGRHPVAGVTIIRRIGVVARFTLRNRSIVTTDTATDYFVVIQRCNKR